MTGRHELTLAALCLCSAILVGLSERSEHVLAINGELRALILHIPTVIPIDGRAVVVVLHGSTEDRSSAASSSRELYPAARFEKTYDASYFEPWRERRGFAMAYLAARLQSGWWCWDNQGDELGHCSHKGRPSDEADFLLAAVSLATRQPRFGRAALGANGKQLVYAFGVSGGAALAWKLLCHGHLHGATAVAGTLAPSHRSSCASNGSVAAFHGTIDPITNVRFADSTAAWIAERCEMRSSDLEPSVQLQEYNCIRSAASLEKFAYYRLTGAGHTIPGGPTSVWNGLGPVSSLDSAEASWAVWMGFPLHLSSGAASLGSENVLGDRLKVLGVVILFALPHVLFQ